MITALTQAKFPLWPAHKGHPRGVRTSPKQRTLITHRQTYGHTQERTWLHLCQSHCSGAKCLRHGHSKLRHPGLIYALDFKDLASGKHIGASKIALLGEGLAATSDNLSSIPASCPLASTHMCHRMLVNKSNENFKKKKNVGYLNSNFYINYMVN